MQSFAIDTLFGLQCFHVLFLGLHDWIPLGSLNDVKAVRASNSGGKLLLGTLISTSSFAFGLGASAYYFGGSLPRWLLWYLSVSYGLLFLGELQAWWIPYFFWSDSARAVRYQNMFGKTHAFLPPRNGIRPNTLHVFLHVMTLMTLLVLSVVLLIPPKMTAGRIVMEFSTFPAYRFADRPGVEPKQIGEGFS